jgi:hypothetical protein
MFYIHIGLHKTATTSLQQSCFNNIPNVKFLGRAGYNMSEADVIYHQVCKYCFTLDEDIKLKDKILKKLQNLNYDVLLSEEWITSDYCGQLGFKGCSWQTRLARLSNLLVGIPHKVLITIRNPKEAIISHYNELIVIDSNYYSTFLGFCSSNEALIYDYKTVVILLQKYFLENQIICFEIIISDKLNNHLKIFFERELDVKIVLANSKLIAGKKVLHKPNKYISLITNKVPISIKKFLISIPIFKKYYRKLYYKLKTTVEKTDTYHNLNDNLILKESESLYQCILEENHLKDKIFNQYS